MGELVQSNVAVFDQPLNAVHVEFAAVSHLAITVHGQELAGIETVIFVFEVCDNVFHNIIILAHKP